MEITRADLEKYGTMFYTLGAIGGIDSEGDPRGQRNLIESLVDAVFEDLDEKNSTPSTQKIS